MHLPKLLVLDDYEGRLAIAPAMNRLRELAEVTILNYPLSADDKHQLKRFQDANWQSRLTLTRT
jgi:hypothetical protein